jgi:hypothetical protein
MRKAFNFFHSYYDVAKELNDKDRLAFLDALIKKQFEGVNPDLSGMAKFAYLSQKHSIETQIKGYFDKTKDPMFDPCQGGTQGGSQGGYVAPSVQEKEEEKEKEKEKYIIPVSIETKPTKISFEERQQRFLDWFNSRVLFHKGTRGNFSILSKPTQNNLKTILKNNYTSEQLNKAFSNMYNSKWVKDNKMCTPTHFLVIDNFEKYLNQDSSSDNVVHTNIELN